MNASSSVEESKNRSYTQSNGPGGHPIFLPGIITKFKEFSGQIYIYKKMKFTSDSQISTAEISKNSHNIYIDHFRYQFCLKNTEIQKLKHKRSISISSVDGRLIY